MEDLRKSLIGRVDSRMFLLYILLVSIGILSIFSVEYRTNDPLVYAFSKSYMKQLFFLGVSLFVGLIILFSDSKIFSSFAYLAYAIGVVLLIITIFVATPIKGSRSWINLGVFSFQSGEVCKIFTALALSKFLASDETNFQTLKHRLIGSAFALLPMLIIILQNETGLALVYFCFFLVMYKAGLPNIVLILAFSSAALTISALLLPVSTMLLLILVLGVIAGYILRFSLKKFLVTRIAFILSLAVALLFTQVVVPFVFKNLLKNYQKERIYTMLGQDVPEQYLTLDEDGNVPKKKDSDYNVRQSKIAIGSGGLFGKGFLNGTSTKNDFVPEQNTDFIFCSVGEQFGFVGSTLLLLLYLALMWRCVSLAQRQRSAFSSYYCYCVASIFFLHVAINVSMTIGLAPVIGITLPLMSYGGSSLLTFSILIFIMLRLDADRGVMIR